MEHTLFVELAERVKLKEISQEATEALIEALAFVMSIDGNVSRSEEQAMVDAILALRWRRDDLSAEEYALQQIAEFIDRGEALETQVSDFCEELGRRISDSWLQDELYVFVARMIRADDRIHESELRFLSTIGATFDIFAERKQALDQRAFAD